MQSLDASQKAKSPPHFDRKQLAMLRGFLDSLNSKQRRALAEILDDRRPTDPVEKAKRVRSIIVWLSQIRSGKRRASVDYAHKLAAASGGRLRFSDVRPDCRDDD